MVIVATEGTVEFAVDHAHRIVLRLVDGRGDWESAYLGGRHATRDQALRRLAAALKPGAVLLTDEMRTAAAHVVEQRARRERAERDAREADDARRAADQERREAIRAKYAGAKYRKADVRLTMAPGEAARIVPALVLGGLAVHKDDGSWTLTHVASGKSLGLTYPAQGDARLVAARLADAADWTTTRTSDLTQDRGLRDLIAAVRVDPLGGCTAMTTRGA